jgi:FKBP-type peptidyl-prolyl cis-trans isomerase SlyD
MFALSVMVSSFLFTRVYSMKIEPNSVVTLHYTLKDNDGNVIDQSDDGSFLYLHGAMNIVPGLESALAGKSAGDEFSVAVSPEEGYGKKDPGRIQEVPKEMFQDAGEIEVGLQFHAQSPDGAAVVVTVIEIKDDVVVIDGNHALAGVDLNFAVKVIEVREASEEEVSHGHVHGPHGHHH